jgi:coenzyme F420-reducing hydrogenase delta subunit
MTKKEHVAKRLEYIDEQIENVKLDERFQQREMLANKSDKAMQLIGQAQAQIKFLNKYRDFLLEIANEE